MADDKKNIPDAGKVDDSPKPGTVEPAKAAPPVQDQPAPAKAEAPVTYVEQELRREVRAAIDDGYTRFISGFAEGTDLMFASIVAEEIEHHPELFLEAAIPYAGRIKTKNQQFHELLRACNGVKIVCEEYEHSCFMQRNRYMAGESQRVIAVYDGRDRGGTLFTMRYAHTLGKEVRVIRV